MVGQFRKNEYKDKYIISYKKFLDINLHEETNNINDIKHPSVRETAKFLKLNEGIEIGKKKL